MVGHWWLPVYVSLLGFKAPYATIISNYFLYCARMSEKYISKSFVADTHVGRDERKNMFDVVGL